MRSSKSTKTVTRRYTTKSGKTVVKTYVYNKKQLTGGRKKYVVSSKGKINKAAIDRLVKKGVGTRFEIEVNVKSQLAQGHTAISEERLEASLTHNRIEGMFANAGVSVESAAAEIGVSVKDLYDQSNWQDGVFTAPDGNEYMFEFNYTGSVWHKV